MRKGFSRPTILPDSQSRKPTMLVDSRSILSHSHFCGDFA